MTQKRLKISIALLVGFVLFTGLLQFVPISISFGKSHHTNSDLRNMPLQPNGTYLVYVKKPMALPDGMEAVPCKNVREGFYHGDARKDKPGVNPCDGGMRTLLQNNGDTKYECTVCGKTWLLSSDDSKIRGEP